MAGKFRLFTKVLFYIAAVAYPVLIFYFLVIRKTPLRMLSLFVIAFALFVFITGTSAGVTAGTSSGPIKKKVKKGRFRCFGMPSFYWVWGLYAWSPILI